MTTTLGRTNHLVTDGIAFARRAGVANHNLSHQVVGGHVHILNCSFDMVTLFAVAQNTSGTGTGYSSKVTKTSACRICNPDAPKTQADIIADLPEGSIVYRHPDLGEPTQFISPDETHGYSTIYSNGHVRRRHVQDHDIWFGDDTNGRACANALILDGDHECYGFAHTSVLDQRFLNAATTTIISLPEFVPTEDVEPWPRTERARTIAERFRPLAVRFFATRHLPAHDRRRYDVDVELKRFAASLSETTAA
ncbi:MAG: hypothetical protein HOY79_17600 [Streptomyces sp.]|nr:hypothetical protein [Streptomyces sp.]